MVYVTLNYYLFVTVLVAAYYLLPLKYRWLALLSGSLSFYAWMSPDGFPLFLASILTNWFTGLGLERFQSLGTPRSKRWSKRWLCRGLLTIGIVAALAPLLTVKFTGSHYVWLPALGISFYSLQSIAYLADIFQKRIVPQRNILKYALFASFFPQIIQGPIPRFGQLAPQLCEGHRFDERTFTKGIHLIIWGFFLKFMLADKAGIFVDAVFDSFPLYQGNYVLAAGVLYSLQLYTDFLACVTLSQGVAGLFGIELVDNFNHPYCARSIQEFWRRWHISLSTWLRDYIYIPLGGNRRGRLMKYIYLTVVFAISGFWHGVGWKFLIWGLIHTAYQIVGSLLAPAKDRFYCALKIPESSRNILQIMGTFFWVMLAWIVFRADTLGIALAMLRSMFTFYNPWVLFDGSLLALGLSGKEWVVLLLSVALLWVVGVQQRSICIRDRILEQHLVVRWAIYLAAICVVWIWGTYGFGFGQDFIYGGF